MTSFYIRFGKWNDNVSGSEGLEIPTFLVFHGAEKKLLFAVNVIHNFSDEIREEKFKQALQNLNRRFYVMLSNGLNRDSKVIHFPPNAPQRASEYL
jgi:hypothetical protein